jgi:hypothetical protein
MADLVVLNNYSPDGRWYAQATGDLSGCEVLQTAATGQSHYVTKIVLSTASAINISIGQGETTPGSLDTVLVGPVYFTTGGPGVFTFDFGNSPLKITSGILLAVDASGSGNATAIVIGFTR